jgi:hypothetical protein
MTTAEGETFGPSVFLRDDDSVYRTYFDLDGMSVKSFFGGRSILKGPA